MKRFPWFGRSRARDALHALSGVSGERVEEAMAKKEEIVEECALCGGRPETESLSHGRVRILLEICPEHVQLAARRTLSRKFAELAESVREKLERT